MKWMLAFFSTICFAQQSVYCPQNSGFVSVGMSAVQVLQACGTPTARSTLDTPPFIKVPVSQLIYTNLSTGSFYPTLDPIYNQWSVPTGTQGISLEVDVVDNKIQDIRVNGNSSDQSTLCSDVTLAIGDPVQKVYSYCGSPGRVNETFIKKYMRTQNKPEVWTYIISAYQPAIKFTLVNNQVVSID